MSGDITEFITARFNEREAAARDLLAGRGMHALLQAFTPGSPALGEIGRWMLRDVAAKRLILAEHRDTAPFQPGHCTGHGVSEIHGDYQVELDECPVLRALASIDSGHPDYREEWKP